MTVLMAPIANVSLRMLLTSTGAFEYCAFAQEEKLCQKRLAWSGKKKNMAKSKFTTFKKVWP